jgi:hypothetical protein
MKLKHPPTFWLDRNSTIVFQEIVEFGLHALRVGHTLFGLVHYVEHFTVATTLPHARNPVAHIVRLAHLNHPLFGGRRPIVRHHVHTKRIRKDSILDAAVVMRRQVQRAVRNPQVVPVGAILDECIATFTLWRANLEYRRRQVAHKVLQLLHAVGPQQLDTHPLRRIVVLVHGTALLHPIDLVQLKVEGHKVAELLVAGERIHVAVQHVEATVGAHRHQVVVDHKVVEITGRLALGNV